MASLLGDSLNPMEALYSLDSLAIGKSPKRATPALDISFVIWVHPLKTTPWPSESLTLRS